MTGALNTIADKWFAFQLAIGWQVAVLIVIVWCVDLVIKKWAWPQVRYALWLLILVKLVLPPTLTSPASLTSNIPLLAEKTVKIDFTRQQAVPKPAETATQPDTFIPMPAEIETETTETSIAPLPQTEQLTSPPPAILSLKFYAMAVWLLGTIVLSTWLIVRLKNLRKENLSSPVNKPLPERFQQLLKDTAEKLKLKTIPKVILTDKVCCPAVFGIFKPVLLFPADKLGSMSRQDTEYILLHELAHIKRGDLFIHAVYMILQIAYWFNPLIWLIRRQLQNLRELCCDATVAKILKEKTCRYRQTLLETAKQLLAEPVDPGIGLLGLFENSNRLLDRLKWLEKKTWKNRPLRIVVIFILVCLMATCVMPMAKPKDSGQEIIEKSEDRSQKTEVTITLANGVQVEGEEAREKVASVVGIQDSALDKSTSAEAAFIIQKVLDRYAAIKTYSAIGKLLTDVERPIEAIHVTSDMTAKRLQQKRKGQLKNIFTIKMARPNLYCIEWSENIDTALSKNGNAWSVGDGSYGLIHGKEKSFEKPLRALIWTNKGVGKVQSSIFFDTSLNTLKKLRDLSQQNDEQLEGIDCYVISGSQHRVTYTYWVSKKDFLIRRYKSVSGGDGKPVKKGGSEPTDETIKEVLEAMDKETTSEEIAKMRAMLIDANAKESKIKVTHTETYRNIILDQPISKEQFVPSKDIDEITEELKNLRAKYIHRLKNISPTEPNFKTDVQVEVEKNGPAIASATMAGTWFFDNPHGDDEQMAIYPDGKVVVLYSNGHKDEIYCEGGFIQLAEYNNKRFKLGIDEGGMLLQTGQVNENQSIEIVVTKKWKRIHNKPQTKLLRPLTKTDVETSAGQVEEKNGKVIALVLDNKIYGEDIEPSVKMIKKNKSEMSDEQYDKWLKQYREFKLIRLIFGPLLKKYADEQNLDVTDVEISEFSEGRERVLARQTAKWQQARDKLAKELENPDISNVRREKIKSRIKKFDKALERRKTSRPNKGYEGPAKAFVGAWKVNKSLFEKYGGRVIFQQGGPEPLDAYREFLKQQEEVGRFEIKDKQTTDLFWNYFTNDNMHIFYSDANEAAKFMETPWWLMNAPEDTEETDVQVRAGEVENAK